ncbi:MAG: PIN domain-containing protein [Lachnospiraceae bacterium]|nr:PIN domain-containing protein [Lachnospiraceae bacterium]
MRILIDTNVILDALTGRQPHFDDADKIIKLCADKKVQGYLAAHSISNIFYILRKDLPIEDRRIVLLNLCEILEVEGVDSRKVKSALNRGDFKDLEDCIQDECAAAIKADYIVTRNKKDFENSIVPAILP